MVCLPWEREGKSLTDDELLEAGRNIMRSEAAEIVRAAGRAGAEFVRAARIIHGLRGRLVVSGMGKSGIIKSAPIPAKVQTHTRPPCGRRQLQRFQ